MYLWLVWNVLVVVKHLIFGGCKKKGLRVSFNACSFISIWKFGIRLGYANNKKKLRLDLCLSYIYTHLNLEDDYKDSYSGILHLNKMLSFSFFQRTLCSKSKTLHCSKKKTVPKNYFTILLIKRFLVKIKAR